jgi:hypothetical protein
MAAGGKLLLVAKCEYGEELETLIPRLLDENDHSANVVAKKMHVHEGGAAIRKWLKLNRYKFNHDTGRWEKLIDPAETAA